MARGSSRQQWKAFIEGGGRAGARKADPVTGAAFTGTVLGVDPSLRGTGFSVVEARARSAPVMLHSRVVRLKASVAMPECLGEIARQMWEVLDAHPIDHVALEQTIYVQNFQTAQILGAARGAAIAAAAARKYPVFEYPPLRVKQAVVGFGRASKEQVARTVMGLLAHGRELGFDEADAAAVALCHIFTHRVSAG
ncbi:MAG: crossover junction endodeoxyribonuclease RuvC [Puniceicoccaceae bacterium]|nr:MAG: crossover junction endodeoxyribonuclease RuvC [Puniceicoccaceae bacterium]